MFTWYVIGFLIPFMLAISSENSVVLNILYTLCMLTQITFIIFEAVQLRDQKMDYFKDKWNLLDSSQFILFTLLYIIKILSQFQTDTLFEIILQAVLLIQSFYKLFYFIRLFEKCAFIIVMAFLIFKEVFLYAIFIIVFTLAFCKQFTVMHMGINDPTGQYAELDS